jgi:putative peptidoglycan lipid II flippase
VARSAAGLTILLALSPVSGLAVEVALAWRLGASSTVDGFRIAASTFLVFGWNLFISEILPNVIVPVFAECRARDAENEGWTAAFSVANVFLIPTTAVCALSALSPGWVIDLLGPGLTGAGREYAMSFTRWFALAVVPLVWSGAAGSILYAYNIFWLPPATSVFGNCIILAALLVLPAAFTPIGLVATTLAASMCTLIMFGARLWPLMRGAGVKARSLLTLDVRHSAARKALGSCMPLLAMTLVNLAANAVMYRVLSEQPSGSAAAFGYAWKMLAFVSLVPGALSVVMFPRLAEAHFTSAPEGFRAICTKGLRMGLYILLPLVVACFVLRFPLTQMLFRRGAFSHEAAAVTTRFFGLLLLFAPAGVVCIYLQRISYAMHGTLTPSLMQCAAQILFIACAPLVGARFGADGLCLLLMTTQWIACALLAHRLSRGHGALDLAGTAAFASELLLLSLVSAWAGAEAVNYFVSAPAVSEMCPLVFRIALTSGLIAGLFLVLTALLGLPEALAWPRHLGNTGNSIVRLASCRKAADL